MNGPHVQQIAFSITVAGGVGSATISFTGELDDVYLAPPAGATFDWNITDSTSTPRGGEAGVSGSRMADCGKRPCIKPLTLNILNATNGTYTGTVNYKQGFSSGF